MSDNIQVPIAYQIYNKRVLQEYSLLEQNIMKLKKSNVLNELEILKLTGVSKIYENQETIAYEVVSKFNNRKIINIMVVAKTQSGKTGSMCATIKKYLEDTTNLIPIENIYIITGLSSCEWKEQTKERLPGSVQSRVFHRSDLPSTFVDEIKNKKNILIIMDEIQVAARKGQTIYNSFKAAGLLDKQKLYENDVKILEYTATPDGTIYDLMKWKDASSKIIATVGDRYVSSYDLLQMGRIKQFKDICGYNKKTGHFDEKVLENIEEIKIDVDSYPTPRWHIIRTKNDIFQDKTQENLIKVFGNINYRYIKYDKESEIQDINVTLRSPPSQHTFILIKEMLRCAKTLYKQFLGVSVERYVDKPDDSSIIQGLVGRNTGNDDNGDSMCYTNIDSIKKYQDLWTSGFDDNTIDWKSKTTKFSNETLSGSNTYNDPTEYDGFSVDSDDSDSDNKKTYIIKKFKIQKDAIEYFRTDLKARFNHSRGPNKKNENANGFYEATIKKITKVWSTKEINDGIYIGAANNKYRLYPCYEDINDFNTLEWWFIHD